MEQIRQFTNSTLTPSPKDLLLAVPRLAQRFLSLPEQFDAFFGKIRNGGSVIAEPTTSQSANSTVITSIGQFIQGNMAAATPPPTTGGIGFDSSSLFNLQNLRYSGVFSYLMSKWALATLTTAVILNRTQFYASSRVPLTLRWHIRLALYLLPMMTFAYQILWVLQTIRCQTSPQWPSLQYNDPTKILEIDYAGEGGTLHRLTSTVLFWQDELDSCAAVNMLPEEGSNLRKAGSLSLLWPLFCSLGFSQWVETLTSSLQGRPSMPETGMTIFEHSLAFAEAEATIIRPFAMLASQSSSGKPSSAVGVASTLKVTRAAFLQASNVPPEVLVISLISSLSHLSSNVLAVAGLRSRFRLVNTGIWGMSYMGVFLWSFARAVASASSESSVEAGILRFPTVCIVGFIPHILILVGICGCALIYGIALLLTAAALPTTEGVPLTLSGRLSAAYRNLQANVHLGATPAIRVSWQEDFYTALLKVGFTVLTAASEAVYLNEGTKVAVNPHTWLEEKRLQEIITERRGLKKTLECIPGELLEDSIAEGIVSSDPASAISYGRVSGYSRERKTKSQPTSNDTQRIMGRENGVGFVQRRSRWVLAFQLVKGMFWLITGLAAWCLLTTMETLRVPYKPRWLTRFLGREQSNNSAKSVRNERRQGLTTKPFWMVSDDGNLVIAADHSVDVEVEMRRRLRDQQRNTDNTSYQVEEGLNTQLYSWWKTGGWWGDADSSGDYTSLGDDDNDDLTSVISATDTSDIDWSDFEEEDGRRTPTQLNPYSHHDETTSSGGELFDPLRLATLLDPQTTEHQSEARLLARHLRSDKIMTRSQHRKALEKERSRIVSSSTLYPSAQMTPEMEEQALEKYLLE